MNNLLEDIPVVLPPAVKVIQEQPDMFYDMKVAIISGLITTVVATGLAYYFSKKQMKQSFVHTEQVRESDQKEAKNLRNSDINMNKQYREEDIKNKKEFLLLEQRIKESNDSLMLCDELETIFYPWMEEYRLWSSEYFKGYEVDVPYNLAIVGAKINNICYLLKVKLIFLNVDLDDFEKMNKSKNLLNDEMNAVAIQASCAGVKNRVPDKNNTQGNVIIQLTDFTSALSELKYDLSKNRIEILQELKD